MTGQAEERAILTLAERVADGSTVDWEEQSRKFPHLAPSIERLRTVQRIADAQRTLTGRGSGSDIAALETTSILSSPEPPDTGNDTWGALTIRSKLGQGAFGAVYRAYDPTLDREVALKLIEVPDAIDTKRFLAEARRLARVRHANVLVVHGAETHGGTAGIWTDLLRGRTLQQYFEQEKTIGSREAALIGLELCRALAAVHREGLVHRDVKPANVMREEGGRIILMDFGAGVEGKPRMEGALASTIEGTPLYMAPEQLLGEAATPAVDIYALGVLLYVAVSGSYPIEAKGLDELQRKQRSGAAVPLRDRRPDLPVEFVQVIERALEPDPRRRFPSAGAFERALAGTLGPAAAPPELHPAAWWIRWRGWSVAALGALATTVAVALLIRWPSSTTQRQARILNGPHASSEPSPGAPIRHEPLVATATLYRGDGSRRKPIQEGAHVAPGDVLSLTIEGSDSMYVYVLNEDTSGNIYVLFPVSGLYPGNPLPPRIPHRLPGRLSDQPVNWEVTTAGGRESILVLANRAPLATLEREILRFPHAKPGAPIRYGQLSEGAVGKLRFIGGMAPSKDPMPARPSRLSEILGRLQPEVSSSINRPWIYQINLENSPSD